MVDLTGHWFSRERFSDKIYKLKIGSCLFQAHKVSEFRSLLNYSKSVIVQVLVSFTLFFTH